MEKFKIYSNDPYDFNCIEQIIDFYKLIENKDALKKITDSNKDKLYLRIIADKAENNVIATLFQDRTKEASHIKLPDLVVEYSEYTLAEAESFIDLSEYMEFD